MKRIPMRSVTKIFTFDAAHKLWNNEWSDEKNKEVFGKCHRLHGHTYKVEITCSTTKLNDNGMVVNFAVIKEEYKKRIHNRFDHQNLNEKMDKLTTAENIAELIFKELDGCVPYLDSVRVWETPTSYAEIEK